MRPRYTFRRAWHLDASPDEVFETLLQLDEYERWWPEVRASARVGDSEADLEFRSFLPVTIRAHAVESRVDRIEGVLEAALSGDLVGWARWVVRPSARGTTALHEQDVIVAGRWATAATLLRPLFKVNHAAMMRSGERALARHLRESSRPSVA